MKSARKREEDSREEITDNKTKEMNKNQVQNVVPKTMNLNSIDNDKSWKNF